MELKLSELISYRNLHNFWSKINAKINLEIIKKLNYTTQYMLGLESERRLKNFLVATGDGESDLELAR